MGEGEAQHPGDGSSLMHLGSCMLLRSVKNEGAPGGQDAGNEAKTWS